MEKKIALFFVAIKLSLGSYGQTNQNTPWGLFNELVSSKNQIIKAYEKLIQKNDMYIESDLLTQSSYFDVLVQLNNYVSNYKKSLMYDSLFYLSVNKINQRKKNNFFDTSFLKSYKIKSALSTILEMAGQKQVIIINEEHRNSAHREFTRQLLNKLYQEGYRYLALEALNREEAIKLNKRKYPNYNSGAYIADPIFGDLVRYALKIGFTILAYEADSRVVDSLQKQSISKNSMFRDNLRDSLQAVNIINQTFKIDPSAKVLVHAGRAHAAKVKIPNIAATMAWHLQEQSRIVPYTIDQTTFSFHGNKNDDHPLYRYVSETRNQKIPFCFFDNTEKKAWSSNESYDAQVFTPDNDFINEYPRWMYYFGYRKKVIINYSLLQVPINKGVYATSEIRLLKVLCETEGKNAVPMQQILIIPSEKVMKYLLLPSGKYKIRLLNSADKLLKEYSQIVK